MNFNSHGCDIRYMIYVFYVVSNFKDRNVLCGKLFVVLFQNEDRGILSSFYGVGNALLVAY